MKWFVTLLIFLVISLSFCAVDAKEVKIFVSNYPLAYFAQRISGHPEYVIFPEIDGDPAFWEPTPEEITTMQQADIILLNGATYEKWRTKVALPRRKIVDTSKGFKNQYVIMEHAVDHSHGPSGDHSHAGTAFTTWLDLTQAVRQAKAIRDALIRNKVAAKDELNKNYEELKKELLTFDKELLNITKGHAQVSLVASHPVYQYFARRYKLNLEAVLWEPDVYPDEGMWRDLKKLLSNHPAKWMIWEGDPLSKSVKKLQKLGVAISQIQGIL